MSNGDSRYGGCTDRQETNCSGRRGVLLGTGTTIAAFSSVPVLTAATNRLDSTSVDWSDQESVAQFVTELKKLDKDEQLDVVSELTVDQEIALSNAAEEQLSYVRTTSVVTGEEAIENGPTLAEDDVGSSAVPALYQDSVTGGEHPWDKEYMFEHQIEWIYDGDDYWGIVSTVDGEANQGWDYDGPSPAKEQVEYSSFFEVERTGLFSLDLIIIEIEAKPTLRLRGDVGGEGETVSKDRDYPR